MPEPYGNFSICQICCFQDGLFDWYGPSIGNTIIEDHFVFRTGTVYPIGANTTTYSSIDAGWGVSATENGTLNIGNIQSSLAAMISPSNTERVWYCRQANEDHPDAPWQGAELLGQNNHLPTWTRGPEAEYLNFIQLLRWDDVNSNGNSDEDLYLRKSVSLENGIAYRLAVKAEKKEIEWIHLSVGSSSEGYAEAWVKIDGSNSSIGTVNNATVEILNYEDNSRAFLMSFISPATFSANITIRLVDGNNELDYTGTDGDGTYIFWASLKEGGFGALHDYIPINAGNETLYSVLYPRDVGLVGDLPGVNEFGDGIWGFSPYGMMQGAMPPARQIVGINLSLADGAGQTFMRSWKNAASAVGFTISPDGGKLGSLHGTAGDSFDSPYQLAQMIEYNLDGDIIDQDWAFLGGRALERIEYPHNGTLDVVVDEHSYWYPDGSLGSGDRVCFHGSTASMNSGPSLPRIVATCAHEYPKVWSIRKPRRHWSTVTACPPYITINGRAYDSISLQQTVDILFGDPVWTSHNHVVTDGAGNNVTTSVRCVYGGGSVVWTKSYTQSRLMTTQFNMEGDISYFETAEDLEHLNADLLWADARATSRAIMVIYSLGEVTINGTVPWKDGDDTGSEPSESYPNDRTWVEVVINGTSVLEEEIWREGDIWASGMMCCHPPASEDAGPPNNPCIWFERHWDTAPTASTAGSGGFWRMHYTSGSGDYWYLDSLGIEGDGGNVTQPFALASSDKWIYVKNFIYCDDAMGLDDETPPKTRTSTSWAFSHVRKSSSPSAGPKYSTPGVFQGPPPTFPFSVLQSNVANGQSYIDTGKKTSRVRLSPIHSTYNEAECSDPPE